ncbi:MAG: T9SS type A sorting domain-containing protein [Bacteroidetes bacterium]|jgi:hypothetical protein|nr:T9SS type A sorting domain-containing protein [Bacteroidota bacterium]
MFNTSSTKDELSVELIELDIQTNVEVYDLWKQEVTGVYENSYTEQVNSHGVAYLKLTPANEEPTEPTEPDGIELFAAGSGNNADLIYPNPVQNTFYLKHCKFDGYDKINISIYDMTGKELMSHELDNGLQQPINLSNAITSGIYTLVVQSEKVVLSQLMEVKR